MVGERLAHFDVTAKLGEGGMGAVYRATDTKLGREVAIKVLPPAVTEDPGRLARFEREARVLAALNHPNIAGIYEVGTHEDVHFIVMELAPGEPLSERIAKGPIPLDEAIPIALKAAAALEAAHEQGIIHRDLKPANIHVSGDGDVKVLDFGLAKAFDDETSPSVELSSSPTLTRNATRAGVLMGTAAYMSPEQARGKAADRRSDIWAFGVVLWELLTGKRLFSEATMSDTLAAVLREEIDLDALPSSTPTALQRLLRRCLERDPTQRLQHIGDARLELEEALSPRNSTTEPSSRDPFRVVAVAALAAALAALATYAVVREEPAPREPRRTLIQTPPLVTVFSPTIAPDGRKGLYSTGDRLWLWELDRFEPRSWEGEFRQPFFSPDSEQFAYEANGELWRMNIETGDRRLICRSGLLWGGIWSKDGTITFARGRNTELFRVPEEGGAVTRINSRDATLSGLNVALPDERGLLFIDYSGGVKILSNGTWSRILDGEDVASVAYSPTGHLFYHRSRDGLWAVPFSLTTLAPTAGALHVDAFGAWPSFSDEGRLSYKRGLDRNQFVLKDRTGRVVRRIGRPQFMLQDPAVSPDGRVVAGISREHGEFNVWLHEVETEQARRVTFDIQADLTSPGWSADGDVLYFAGNGPVLWALDLGSDAPPRRLAYGRHPHASPDGSHVVFYHAASVPASSPASQQNDIFFFETDAANDVQPFLTGPANEFHARISPTGALIAYISDESGRNELYLRRFPSGEGLQQVSTDGATTPRWSHDGSELYYLRGRDLMAAPVRYGATIEPGESERLFALASPRIYEYSVTPDGLFVEVLPSEENSTLAIVDEWQSFFEAGSE